jgi:glucosylceramidase
MRFNFLISSFLLAGLLSVQSNCSKNKGADTTNNNNNNNNTSGANISSWITKGDQSALLQKQADIKFGKISNPYQNIDVDSTQAFQTIDGFGYTLTGGSAYLINQLGTCRQKFLTAGILWNRGNSIAVNYLRISIGSSDLNASVFSYDDMPAGQTDVNLDHFNLSQDTIDLIPVLKQILAINPNIKMLGSPWSPPVWMKDNGNSIGGSLLTQYYDAYARYFVNISSRCSKWDPH